MPRLLDIEGEYRATNFHSQRQITNWQIMEIAMPQLDFSGQFIDQPDTNDDGHSVSAAYVMTHVRHARKTEGQRQRERQRESERERQ